MPTMLDLPCFPPGPIDPKIRQMWVAGLILRTFYQEVHNRSFYSVPFRNVGQKVRVISTFSKIAIYDLNTLEKIASHSTSRKNGERCTDELRWPPEKKEHCDFNIERAKDDAAKFGSNMERRLENLSKEGRTPEELVLQLLEDENPHRKNVATKTLETRAKFRRESLLENWDSSFERGVSKSKIRDLATLGFWNLKKKTDHCGVYTVR